MAMEPMYDQSCIRKMQKLKDLVIYIFIHKTKYLLFSNLLFLKVCAKYCALMFNNGPFLFQNGVLLVSGFDHIRKDILDNEKCFCMYCICLDILGMGICWDNMACQEMVTGFLFQMGLDKDQRDMPGWSKEGCKNLVDTGMGDSNQLHCTDQLFVLQCHYRQQVQPHQYHFLQCLQMSSWHSHHH